MWGSQSSAPFLSWKDKQDFTANGPRSVSRVAPLQCCEEGVTQQTQAVQTLHIPKKGLALDLPQWEPPWPWNILLDKNVVVCLWPWTTPVVYTNSGIYGWGPWSRRVRNEGQPQGCAMPTWLTPGKPEPPRLCVLPWLALLCMCCHALFLRELSAVHITPLGEDDWKLVPGLSADFNRYPFTVVHHNSEYHSFSESCESYWWLIEMEGNLGDPRQHPPFSGKACPCTHFCSLWF